jgi:phosphate transport system substrate-binding protein
MNRTKRLAGVGVLALSLILVAAACSSGGGGGGNGGSFSGASLTGAGATFPDPVYETWFQDFQQVEQNAQINYQAIGSGGGIEQLQQKTVDFGASDAPLQPEDMQGFGNEKVIQFPTVVGGVAFAYNVPGLDQPLDMDGPTIADIFLGKIKNWNDPAIAKLNPGVKLPNQAISVCHRADESGTTFIFTNWLSQESPTWASQVGADKAVQWPTGNGGNGNDGVAACISQAQGGAGYVEYQFAVTTNLGVASIKGKNSSDYVAPSTASISAAAGGLSLPITPTTNILNSKADGAYPISSTTYLLVPKDLKSLPETKAQTVVDFVYWALNDGQSKVRALNYAQLPETVRAATQRQLDELQFGSQTIKPTPTVRHA